MPRQIKRLSATKIATINRPGMYADGNGLYLQVTTTGSKSWIYRYKSCGRAHDMGLGSARLVGLSEARELAAEADCVRHNGRDPIVERKAARAAARRGNGSVVTFDDAAAAYIAAHEPAWKNPKHRAQWRSTLATYASPKIGSMAVTDVDTDAVLAVLQPIWHKIPETASRLRGRIELVLDWAKARGFRNGDNPARWRGHLQSLLPPKSKLRSTKHHAAVPFTSIAQFVALLREGTSVSARALEFLILTASRTNEVLDATWDEIDFTDRSWVVPPERMKSAREHRVPLGPRAVAILKNLKKLRQGPFIFQGQKAEKPLSSMSMAMLLRDLGYNDFTVHGFRSTFRDWAAEQTNFSREVAEAALAHVIPDKVEAAYRRGDLFSKRRDLLIAWEAFCDDKSEKTARTRKQRPG